MNTRLSKDNIRFRVSPEEFQILLSEGTLADTVHFPNNHSLDLQISTDNAPPSEGLKASYSDNLLSLHLSPDTLREMAEGGPDKEGVKAEIPLGEDQILKVSFQIDVGRGK